MCTKYGYTSIREYTVGNGLENWGALRDSSRGNSGCTLSTTNSATSSSPEYSNSILGAGKTSFLYLKKARSTDERGAKPAGKGRGPHQGGEIIRKAE